MKILALAFYLLFAIAVEAQTKSNRGYHEDIKVFSFHSWSTTKAKSCLLFNGQSFLENGTASADPKVMTCNDGSTKDWQESNERATDWTSIEQTYPYVMLMNVELDDKSEAVFHSEKKFAAPLWCVRKGAMLRCVAR